MSQSYWIAGLSLLLMGVGQGSATEAVDPNDIVGYVLRIEASQSAEATAIIRQIRNGPRALAGERDRARQEGIPVTVAELQEPAPPPGENAAPLYTQLTRLLKNRPLDEKASRLAGELGVAAAPLPETVATVRDFLRRRQDVLKLVHEAVSRPRCVFQRDWLRVWTGEVAMPEQAAMRHAARLLQAESLLLARDRRFAEAIDNQAVGFRLAEHAFSQPSGTGPLVGIACDAIALDGMAKILYLAGPDATVASRLRDTLNRRHPAFPLRRMFQADVVWSLNSVPSARAQLYRQNQSASHAPPGKRHGQRVLSPSQLRTASELLEANAADIASLERQFLAMEKAPYPKRNAFVIVIDDSGAELQVNPIRYLTGKLFSVLVGAADAKRVTVLAQAEVLKAAAGVISYRARRGAFPDALQQAVPIVPRDPFNDQPLGYRRDGSGFVVYSVGPRGDFDGGRPSAPRDRAQAYFRYPAPPPEPPAGRK